MDLLSSLFIFPGGTISTWPANIKLGLLDPNLAYKFFTGEKPFSLNSNIFVLKSSFLILFLKTSSLQHLQELQLEI